MLANDFELIIRTMSVGWKCMANICKDCITASLHVWNDLWKQECAKTRMESLRKKRNLLIYRMEWIRNTVWWRGMNWDCVITENKSYMVFDVKQLPGTPVQPRVFGDSVKWPFWGNVSFVGLRTQSNFRVLKFWNNLKLCTLPVLDPCVSKILDERMVGFWEKEQRKIR